MYFDIKGSEDWISVDSVTKGWSSDRKYTVVTRSGDKLLLRLSDIGQYEEKKKEYQIITKYAGTGIPMSKPLDFGICSGGRDVYILLTWVEGRDLEDVLPGLELKEQYALGVKAGRILRTIHSIPVEDGDIPVKTKKEKKLMQLKRYEDSSVRVEGDETAVRYVRDNIDNIWKEKPVYQHGDFHPGNLIYMDDGDIGVIDFNRWEVGDPYEEFYKLQSFGTECSIPYCIGQIDSYFDGNVPHDFWVALAVYVAHASLFSVKWAEPFGQEDIDNMVRRCKAAFEDYDQFRSVIPKWYQKGLREVT